ncbi:MAG: hypothetical protein KAI71_02825 [Candidatus Pacebacteria bacterium]|nr:hypothetical protein [Candidatus Paceibacterota bacterium]
MNGKQKLLKKIKQGKATIEDIVEWMKTQNGRDISFDPNKLDLNLVLKLRKGPIKVSGTIVVSKKDGGSLNLLVKENFPEMINGKMQKQKYLSYSGRTRVKEVLQ